MKTDIVVVEDEPAIQSLLTINLAQAGYASRTANDAREAQALVDGMLPDLVLLDWMLPDRSGIELLQRWRGDARTAKLPVLMLTARNDEADIVRALEAGADDYLTKPFSPRELLARIHALLRRAVPEAAMNAVAFDGLRLDPSTVSVTAKDASVKLSPMEFRLLHYLMKHSTAVHSRSKLLDAVWGDHVFIEERTVDVHIRRLRAALAAHGYDYIVETVRGGGYRLAPRD